VLSKQDSYCFAYSSLSDSTFIVASVIGNCSKRSSSSVTNWFTSSRWLPSI